MMPTVFGIPSYGIAIAGGTLVVMGLARRLARREGIDPEVVIDVTLICAIVGLLGTRAAHVLEFWEHYRQLGWTEVLRLDRGGLSWYGSLLVLPAAWLYFRRRGLPVLRMLDLFALYLPAAQLFGRLGCFAAGCCWGERVSEGASGLLAWSAVRFPVGSPAWLAHAGAALGTGPLGAEQAQAAFAALPPALQQGSWPVVPVQLLLSAAGLVVSVVCLFCHGRLRRHGQLFALVFTLLAAARFGLEALRGDNPMLGPLSLHQYYSLAAALGGALGYAALGRWGPPRQAPVPAR
ncbi:MAG: hypothetical protein KatS3mg102_1680 [Planctomycetota bacterium]|nr:MAG: hypothetical protein KatS3mg102_1680 [Planctomycetota bacterium]